MVEAWIRRWPHCDGRGARSSPGSHELMDSPFVLCYQNVGLWSMARLQRSRAFPARSPINSDKSFRVSCTFPSVVSTALYHEFGELREEGGPWVWKQFRQALSIHTCLTQRLALCLAVLRAFPVFCPDFSKTKGGNRVLSHVNVICHAGFRALPWHLTTGWQRFIDDLAYRHHSECGNYITSNPSNCLWRRGGVFCIDLVMDSKCRGVFVQLTYAACREADGSALHAIIPGNSFNAAASLIS